MNIDDSGRHHLLERVHLEAVFRDDRLHLAVSGQHDDLHVNGRTLYGAHPTVQRVELADGELARRVVQLVKDNLSIKKDLAKNL